MGGSNFSSELSSGRRPTSKSDEKLDPPILVIVLQMSEKVDFAQKWFRYWEHDPHAQNEAVNAVWWRCDYRVFVHQLT